MDERYKPMRKLITTSDYTRLLDFCLDSEFPKGLAIALIAYTGARANEILKLTHESFDVNESSVSVFITASKLGQDRWITLGPDCYAPIKVLREELKKRSCTIGSMIGSGSLSIANSYELLRIYFNRIQHELLGEQKYTLHAWRHSLAVRALKSGFDIVNVKTILGHKAINTTMHYLREYEQSIVLNNVHKLVRSEV